MFVNKPVGGGGVRGYRVARRCIEQVLETLGWQATVFHYRRREEV